MGNAEGQQAVEQVSETDSPAPTESGISGTTANPAQPYPGVESARTAEREYMDDSGAEMITHWWFLEDAETGTIYAVEFQGVNNEDSAALIESIDDSLSLGSV